MAAPKRSAGEIAHDRRVIAQLYLHGIAHADIAHRLNDMRDQRRAEAGLPFDYAAHITRQQITYDLDVLRREWAAQAAGDLDQQRGEQLAKIDAIEATYWAAWERSLRPKKTQSAATGTSADPSLATQVKTGSIRTMIKTEERDGNPVYLAGVERCIERRCKILGLDAPQLLNTTLQPAGGQGAVSIRWLTDAEALEQAQAARDQRQRERALFAAPAGDPESVGAGAEGPAEGT